MIKKSVKIVRKRTTGQCRSYMELIRFMQFIHDLCSKFHNKTDIPAVLNIIRYECIRSHIYNITVLLLTDNRNRMKVASHFQSKIANFRAFEKIADLKFDNFQFDIGKKSILNGVLSGNKTVIVPVCKIVREFFTPEVYRKVLKRSEFRKRSVIFSPIRQKGRNIGMLCITAPVLVSHFIPTVRTLSEYISNALDITDANSRRKLAEKSLRESEGRYHQLFENESDAVVIFDGETLEMEDANRSALELFGYPRAEFLTLDAMDISVEKEASRQSIRKVITGLYGSDFVPRRYFQKKDGTVFPGEIYAGSFIHNGKKKIIGAIRDITDRLNAEKEIGERNRHNALRAEIWKLASDKSLKEEDLIQELLNRIGPFTGVSRACYNKIIKKEPGGRDMECVLEWREPGAKATLGLKMPAALVSYFIQDEFFVLDRKTALAILPQNAGSLPEDIRHEFENAIQWLADECDLDSVLVMPYFVSNRMEGMLTLDVCTGKEPKPAWSDELKAILKEVVAIISGRIAQNKAEAALAKAHAEMEIRVRERTAELAESEEKFRSLAEQSPNMIFINKHGRIVYVNPKCEQLMGYTREEFYAPDFNFFSLIAPDYINIIKRYYQMHLEGYNEPVSVEYRLVTKDKKLLEAYIMTKLIFYEGETAILGVVTDISDLKRAETALQQSQARYRAIVEDQTELICRYLPDGTLTFVNDAYCRYFNKTREELLGHNFIPLIVPEDREPVQRLIGSLSKENPVVTIEERVIAPDGGICWQQWSNRMIFDGEGKLVEYQAVGRDITEQKQAETELQKAKDELEKQNKELKKLDKIKDGLLRDVAHELKTPVAKQAMQIELLREQLPKTRPHPEAEKIMGVMQSALKRQEIVIRNILNLSRLEAGGRIYKSEPIRLDSVLDEVLSDYLDIMNSHQIRLEKDLDPVTLTSDGEMLFHVFSNLVNNAVKYRSKTGPPEIKVELKKEDGRALVRIADNGIGMTPEEKAHAFDDFFQASASFEGIGVGLSICKRIVADLGGKIRIESRGRDRGTEVFVELNRGNAGRA